MEQKVKTKPYIILAVKRSEVNRSEACYELLPSAQSFTVNGINFNEIC